MDDLVSLEDLRTYFRGTTTLFRGIPVQVVEINAKREFFIVELLTRKEKLVPFKAKDFSDPVPRLGFVNINNICVYLQRKPVRKYQMGINSQNVIVSGVADYNYKDDVDTRSIARCATPEVAKTLLNQYPTMREALDRVAGFEGIVAFERQFAIDHTRTIYYKLTQVGKLPKNCTRPERTEFFDNFKHLACVIGEPSYDKIARTVGA